MADEETVDEVAPLRDSEDDDYRLVDTELYDVLGAGGEVVERVHLSAADAERYGDRVRPATPDPEDPDAAVELKGAALDEALDSAGLSKSGTADEKRTRLAEHLAGGG